MLNEFKEYLILNHKKKNTVISYFTPFKQYYKYCDGNINQETLNKFLSNLRERNVSTNTYNIFIISMKKYCVFQKLELDFPKTEKVDYKITESISEEQLVDQILPMTSLLFNDFQRRDLILMMLFYTGMRKSELANLKRDDIDFETGIIKVRISKSKAREIPFIKTSQRLYDSLKKYFIMTIEKDNALDITTRVIDYTIDKINSDLNLKEHLTPHLFRASFARHCNLHSYSGDDIMVMLGHSSLGQTSQYIQSNIKSLLSKTEFLKKQEINNGN